VITDYEYDRLLELGTKLKTQGNTDAGIKFYKLSLFYNHKCADAWYNLGVAYVCFCPASLCVIANVCFDWFSAPQYL